MPWLGKGGVVDPEQMFEVAKQGVILSLGLKLVGMGGEAGKYILGAVEHEKIPDIGEAFRINKEVDAPKSKRAAEFAKNIDESAKIKTDESTPEYKDTGINLEQKIGQDGLILSGQRAKAITDVLEGAPEGRVYVETDGLNQIVRKEPVDITKGLGYYTAKEGNVGRVYEPQRGGKAFEDVTRLAEKELAGNGTAEGAGKTIDGIKITDGKVGGKIPVDEFKTIRQASIKNTESTTLTLGRFTPTVENGVEDWSRPGPDSYITKAGKSSYFDLGSDYKAIQKKYGLKDSEMFDYFNKPALDEAISKGKTIRFSHNPLDFEKGSIVDEWEYIKSALGKTDSDLIKNGDYWYVR